ncbi:MAG: serine/threonine-protein kinase, partial [Rhodanobacteraceae bacterium]
MSDRLARVEALFHAALERPADERAHYLASAEDDATIRAQVARLLAHHAEDDTLLRDALDAALAATVPAPRERIGAYRVLRELGAGGMGTVFLAERHIGEARQRVALKLIRGFPTADARARLARERTLLAELNHPNIARLLDGGDTDDGQPYLVMEYIEGRALGEHAATLPVDAKLRLVARLCRAVQHAHQRLVVHRDIKPGNVIVRDDGEPVLLDFGIGKWLADDAGHTATRVFTPAYAAPEQRRGAPATTASDVYGLGCLLCELVADARLADRDPETPVPRPSRLATNAAIARRLAGDIDQIVQKAAHADPDRRYASADALAADIERHLAGRPIAAAPDRFAYRARKYFVRHRAAVIAGVAAFL